MNPIIRKVKESAESVMGKSHVLADIRMTLHGQVVKKRTEGLPREIVGESGPVLEVWPLPPRQAESSMESQMRIFFGVEVSE